MTIREEFEKAFAERFGTRYFVGEGAEEALWAAKWMAERCAGEAEGSMDEVFAAKNIRQLAKELNT